MRRCEDVKTICVDVKMISVDVKLRRCEERCEDVNVKMIVYM